MLFIVKDLCTGKIHEWSLAQVLHEINRDTSEGFEPYNASDWEEGWECWAEGDCFTMLERREECQENTAVTKNADSKINA